jgi:hypothetical protein
VQGIAGSTYTEALFHAERGTHIPAQSETTAATVRLYDTAYTVVASAADRRNEQVSAWAGEKRGMVHTLLIKASGMWIYVLEVVSRGRLDWSAYDVAAPAGGGRGLRLRRWGSALLPSARCGGRESASL